MLFRPNMNEDKRSLYHALVVPLVFSFLFVFIFIFCYFADFSSYQLGVYPRSLKGLHGILTMPLVHGGFAHLMANLPPFFVLTVLLFSSYRKIAMPVLSLIWLCTGVLLWGIGRDSWHIGASGLIYGLSSFLFLSGLFRRDKQLMAVSLVVVFLYGSILWYMFPWGVKENVSWEGHLSGAVVGVILALFYRNSEPQKPAEPEEEDEEEFPFDWQIED